MRGDRLRSTPNPASSMGTPATSRAAPGWDLPNIEPIVGKRPRACRRHRYRRNLHRPPRLRFQQPNTFVQAKSLTTPAQLVQGIIDCLQQKRHQGLRDRRADPRLDHRHQHADRAQGRQDRPGRHPRHPRRLHHRPRQPPGGLQPPVPPAPPAGVAPAHPRGRRARARLRRRARAAAPAQRRGSLPRARRRRRRSGRGLLPALLSRSLARARSRRDDPQGAAGRLPLALARHPARISRVRAHVDDGGERLYRTEGRRLCLRA